MATPFVLICGRSARQGRGINEGKFSEAYRSEIGRLRMASDDMARLGWSEGQRVRVTSRFGQVEVELAPAGPDELPSGIVFMAYGDPSSRLMGADTEGSGMPTSKGLDVDLEKL